ncbi:hypothetical protein JHW43_000941 [Diplocarpon mali]|nr:hypothetical protein JHW43_000941 [Diplocarpon mali]
MNWTGGRLQRHSTAKSSAAQRQKRYFAKVQQNLPEIIVSDSKDKVAFLMRRVQAAKWVKLTQEEPATPPRMLKRNHEGSQLLTEKSKEQNEESLSDKKRRILRKGDWLGITIQRPLKLAFASPRDEQRIGKRRKVSKDHEAKIIPAQSRIMSPFAARIRHNSKLRADSQQFERTGPLAPDVRISIGGRAVQPGVSSSTRPRRKMTPSIVGQSSRVPSSSDIMLLDHESVRGYQAGREFNASLSRIPRGPSLNLHILEQASENSGISGKGYLSADVSLEMPDDQRWAGVTEESLRMLQSNFQGHQRQLVQEAVAHPLASPKADFRQDLVPGEVFFSSSSASLHHPEPRSSQRSILLRSNSLEAISSNIAQIGMANRIFPSSQALQSEIWRTWIATEDDSEDARTNTNSYELPPGNGWISPGISVRPPRKSSQQLPAEDRSSSKLEESDTEEVVDLKQGTDLQQCYENSSTSEQEDNHSIRSEQSRYGGTTSQLGQLREDNYEPPERQATDIEVVSTPLPAENRIMSPPFAKTAKINTAVPLAGKERIEDPSDVWRKFVFGSSSDGVKTPCSGLVVGMTSSEIGLTEPSIVAQQAIEYG